MKDTKKGFGTAPVFFTAISTILGAILFLRFGYSVGMLGFVGTLLVVFLGHLVTIPTALAISEIATNQRVEGGGEYFIISRSFGLNIGATIGIALYMSQAISVAFYVIAFTEAFEPLFTYFEENWFYLPRQAISVPAMLGLTFLMLKRGADVGVKALYFVVAILAVSLILFFMGDTGYSEVAPTNLFSVRSGDLSSYFFIVFAIIFPAFTGMTAGVGLSGDLKNPAKSIPLGTSLATILGMIIYGFIAWKLYVSASQEDLIGNQLIMKDIALFGVIVIPLGLAASTLSSALGSIMVAPRTLQALGIDESIPFKRLNKIMAKGKGKANEPVNATILTSIIAMIFVLQGGVDSVAKIISMFFMLTYGSICLISFLYHFGADPSYRPIFRSRWIVSLIGFVVCIWLMFKMDTTYAIASCGLIVVIYFIISSKHKDRGGMQSIFQGAIFQLSRNIQIFIQKSKKSGVEEKWRPSVVCVSQSSLERDKAFRLLSWISERHGFGTYIHLIEDYFSKTSNQKADEILERLVENAGEDNKVYIDTLISPSYTSAVAQIIQLPGISGMSNNMILFEYDRANPDGLNQIMDNIPLTKAAGLDVCVLGSVNRKINFKKGIDVWIRSIDFENSNLMILLSYIILGHPDWKKSKIKIYEVTASEDVETSKEKLLEIIKYGRLPISPANIEIIEIVEGFNVKAFISEKSHDAGLTVIGFRDELLKRDKQLFEGFDQLGDVLFVNSAMQKEIS